MSSGPENKFRKELVTALKHHFGAAVYIQKNHGTGFSSGLVDMEVVLRAGMLAYETLPANVGFYELKASAGVFDSQSVTALQLVTLKAIDAAGGRAHVLHYTTTSQTVGLYTVRSLGDRYPTPSTWGLLKVTLAGALALRVMLNL